MADDQLAVWLGSVRVALVDQQRGRLRLNYTDDAFKQFRLGEPVLSLSLPLARVRYSHGVVRAFLDGLLPEGEQRPAVARKVNVAPEDTYGLIRALGRDCAGALVFQPANEPAPAPATTLTAQPLNADEIANLVGNLRSAPLGVSRRARISLAGVQEKLLLTRMPDGRWGQPVDGTPSTHILKPEIAAYPKTVENEAFCMRLAHRLGLAAAHVETTVIGGRALIVVQRYDRRVRGDGWVERLHQEDFCQATGTRPDKKYQEDGGPSLAKIAQILQTAADPESIETLLRSTTLNVLIGNGDAHAKNFSLLHRSPGDLTLAPLYDLMCTLHWGDNRLAMYIDNVQRTDRVTAERITKEATRWGFSQARARSVIDDLLSEAPAAIAAACDETEGLPQEVVAIVQRQLRQLRSAAHAA